MMCIVLKFSLPGLTMGRCLFASCHSSTSDKSIVFFRPPLKTDPAKAKLWLNRAHRKDLTIEMMTYNHVVCQKHFNASQVEGRRYGHSTRLYLKPGELPLINGQSPTRPITKPVIDNKVIML